MPSGSVIRYEGSRGVVWRVKYRDATGRQVMETVGAERDGVTRRQAEAELRERLVKVDRRGWRKPAPLTFADYGDRWFAEGETKRRWKDTTLAQYRSVRRRLVKAFGSCPLAAVRPRDVAAYIGAASLELSPATVGRDVSVLHAIFVSAQREEFVETNPAARAERPKVPRRRWRILEPHEVARVERAFTDEQARVVFLTLVLLGLRRFEAQRLRWRDVDLVDGVLRVVASKSEAGERSIAIPPRLLDALMGHYARTAYKRDGELVFCHPQRGTEYRAYTFQEQLEAALAAAGVDAKIRPFHDLRHASLTNGAAAGESPIALMTRAGHSNMSTTKRYLHLAGTVFRDEADRLEERLLGTAVSTEPSTRLSAPEPVSANPASLNRAESESSDRG
jgi:integrase